MRNAGVDGAKEHLGGFDALLDWRIGIRLRRVAVNLGSVEY